MAAANVTASGLGLVRPVTFIEIQFDAATLYVHDHIGSFTWNSQTWTGLGALGAVSHLQESDDRSPYRVSLTLSGIDATIIDEALNQEIYERLVIIYIGFIGDDGALVADPDERIRGYADSMEVSIGGDTDTVKLNMESELIRDTKANGLLFSDEDQQTLYGGDTGFQFLAQLIDARIWWGPGGIDATAGIPLQARGNSAFGRDYQNRQRERDGQG